MVSGSAADAAGDVAKGEKPGRSPPNSSVSSLSWSDVGVIVKDGKTKGPLETLSSNYGTVKPGDVVALMGPSGSGKTTLLNVLAHRTSTMKGEIKGSIMLNGHATNAASIQKVSTYVEQEDAMIGILTTRETIDFAARLSLTAKLSKSERLKRVDELIQSFGLQRQADTIVGTPLRRGLSGGQKRRLSVASQLVTSPRILFLDEPTSGLDSAASFEVVKYIREVAKLHQLIVIASIHQPSTTTFQLFDQLMLLSKGKTCYFGPVSGVEAYFEKIGHLIPLHTNPAEFLLDLVNSDFNNGGAFAEGRLQHVHDSWTASDDLNALKASIANCPEKGVESSDLPTGRKNAAYISYVLLHRNFIKSYRDIIAYGTRVAMYFGLAIMMGM